jgi:hypothetical protein
MLALASRSPQPLGSIFDPLIKSLTSTAVTSATAAAQPLLDDVEQRVKKMLLPVVLFAGGSFLIGLLTYREVRRSRSKALSGRHR